MKLSNLLTAASLCLCVIGAAHADVDAQLTAAEQTTLKGLIDSDQRSEKARARNKYRNPYATLNFFGVKQDQTVVEIWPGGQGGWYRSILEPYLEENGTYIPVRSNSAFPRPVKKVPDGSADRVLVFRAHGFMIYEIAVMNHRKTPMASTVM